MVDVEITANEVVIRPRGLHRLWTLQREIRLPRTQLKAVEVGVTKEARARLRRSVRLPGTAIPFLITAGSFGGAGGWAFWDVAGKGNHAVTLLTAGNRYVEVVVDVLDPSGTVDALRRAMVATPPGS